MDTTETVQRSVLADTFLVAAAILMIVGGMFHFIEGLAALINDEFFVVVNDYAFDVDLTTWGWIHVLTGILVMGGGFALFSGALWARILAIAIAVISAVVNFFYIPYYPLWSIIILVVNALIIWALVAHGRDLAEA